MRKVLPPPQKKIELLILPAVKQVPHNQQLPRLKILDQRQQPQQVLPVHRLRDCDPGLPEMTRLPEMQIRQDERPLLLPINTPVRGKPQLLTAKMIWICWLHRAQMYFNIYSLHVSFT
jgi:hypothetical protein